MIDEFIEKFNNYLMEKDTVNKEDLKEIGKKVFKEVYNTLTISRYQCEEDDGFAVIPGTIKGENGKEYFALLDISVRDSGEHWGTTIWYEGEWIEQEKFEYKMYDYEEFMPYKYKTLVDIIGDVHQQHQY